MLFHLLPIKWRPPTGRVHAVCTRVGCASCQLQCHPKCRTNTWYISSAGRVKNSFGSITYGYLQPSGYRVVQIEKRNFYVHRLIAAGFLGPPPAFDHWQVNHIDGDRANNDATNLQYVTPAQNVQHSWKARSRRKTGTPVLARVCNSEAWSTFPSQAETARALGVSKYQIWSCCRRTGKTVCAGDTWYEVKHHIPVPEQNEIWAEARYPGKRRTTAIPGLMVSNKGRVHFAVQNRVTYGSCRPDRYYCVRKDEFYFLVHRLVAASFLGQPKLPDMHVNHKDGNPGNNSLNNLEYATPSQNVQHSYLVKDRVVGSGTSVQVRTVDLQAAWQTFPSIKAAALYTGVRAQTISQICKGHRAQSASRQFRFAEEEMLPGEEWRPVVLEGARVQSGFSTSSKAQ